MAETTMKIEVHIDAGYSWVVTDDWEGSDIVGLRNTVDDDGKMDFLAIGTADDAEALAEALKTAAASLRKRTGE